MAHNKFAPYIFPFVYAGSNMYIFVRGSKALIIDPCINNDAFKLLEENNVRDITVLLTHEHYDHTSGLNWLSDKYHTVVICHSETARSLRAGKNSRPILITASHMSNYSREELSRIISQLPQNYSYEPDIVFDKEYFLDWDGHMFHLLSTPGHSLGSCCIETDDIYVATGDSLILGTPVITRFPGGSAEDFNNITMPYLKTIPDNTLILPGHGKTFFMKEARDYNEKN